MCLNFCCDFLGHVGKWLDKKAKLNFKVMTSKTGKQITTAHILPNISIGKRNQTRVSGQLIEKHEMFFLKNHTQNVMGKLVPDTLKFMDQTFVSQTL